MTHKKRISFLGFWEEVAFFRSKKFIKAHIYDE